MQDRKKLKIRVNEKWCKACGICMAFCPKKALTPMKNGKPTWNDEACIRCGLCEVRCPDFAIVLGGDEDDKSKTDAR